MPAGVHAACPSSGLRWLAHSIHAPKPAIASPMPAMRSSGAPVRGRVPPVGWPGAGAVVVVAGDDDGAALSLGDVEGLAEGDWDGLADVDGDPDGFADGLVLWLTDGDGCGQYPPHDGGYWHW